MLTNNAVHGSRAFEETRSFLAAKGLSLDFAERPGRAADRRFSSTINALYAGRFYLAFMRYGADVAIGAPADRGDYGISIPLGGGMASTANGEMVACDARRTVLASPGQPQQLVLDGRTERLSLSLQQDAVRGRLAVLIGEQLQSEVVFDPIIDLGSGVGQVIAANMQLIVAEEDKGLRVFANPLRLAQFEEMVLSTLLLYHPHNHSALLEGPQPAPASRDVKRVIDYLHANLDQPLRLDDLVVEAGVPGRTLNEHFRAFTGLSPMGYLKKLRLQAARRDLLLGRAVSVTDVALDYGFLHMGRFAGDYGDAFGETPSHTLARARRVRS